MPRTALVSTRIPVDGLRLDQVGGGVVAGDVANGNVCDCNDSTLLWARNVNAAAQDLTLTATIEGITLTKVVELAAGEARAFALDASVWGRHGAVDGGKAYVNVEHANILLAAILG